MSRRKRTARFPVVGMLGRARPERGTVEILPCNVFRVRPYRSRRVYEVTLDEVASMVALRINAAIAREKIKARKAARLARRASRG